MARDARQVAGDHLDAVRSGDPAAMAADYAPDAVLVRAGARYEGRTAIEAYFRSVPARLGQARVVFDELSVVGQVATFRWHLEAGEIAVSGTDVCSIHQGLIVHQVVHLATGDF